MKNVKGSYVFVSENVVDVSNPWVGEYENSLHTMQNDAVTLICLKKQSHALGIVCTQKLLLFQVPSLFYGKRFLFSLTTSPGSVKAKTRPD